MRPERQCVVDGGEHRQPAVQAGDPQDLRDRRPRRDEAETASRRVGAVGDPDEGAEPAGIAEGQAGQVGQQQPGRAGDGCVALLGQALGSGEIQLGWHAQDLDPGAAVHRRLVLALGHRRLQSVVTIR